MEILIIRIYEKNNKIGLFPDKVSAGSFKKVWWKCKKGHSWQAKVASRTEGHNCPICNNAFPKKVQCVETGIIYNSLYSAAKAIKLTKGNSISLCCRGKQKTAGGYHWKYLDDNK